MDLPTDRLDHSEISDPEVSEYTTHDFLVRLQQRVTCSNAQLLLQSALIGTGLTSRHDTLLNKDEFKTLCLELIRRGGPAFHVGQAMYKEGLL